MKNNTSRLTATFERLKKTGKKALITFITAGDPDIRATEEIVRELEKSGADIIELGIPFSDPMADGPTIQASSERAIKAGTHLSDVLALIGRIREKSSIPIVLFGYYNPVFRHGLKKFAAEARANGADGVLIVDLPPEESGELKAELDKNGIALICLLTPTSDASRMRLVAKRASGFVYFVSVTGVTGARKNLSADIRGSVRQINKFTGLPVAVGFGVSTPEQAGKIGAFADGVVVGSAIINVIAANSGKESLIAETGSFVSSIRKGIDA